MTWLWLLNLHLAGLAVFFDIAGRAPKLDWHD